MALFKVERGSSEDLLVKRPTITDGYAYFTPDDGKFYIDVGTTGEAAIIGTKVDDDTGANRILINSGTGSGGGSGGDGAPEVIMTFSSDDPIPDPSEYKIWINQVGTEILTSYNVTHETSTVGDTLNTLEAESGDGGGGGAGGLGDLQDFSIEIKMLNNAGAGWNHVYFDTKFYNNIPSLTANAIGEYYIFLRNITKNGFEYKMKDFDGNDVTDTTVKFNYQAIEYGGE